MVDFKKLAQALKKESKSQNSLSEAELTHFDTPLLVWKAPSFIKYNRNKSWYITAFSLLFILVSTALFLGSPTFAIAIIVFAMVYGFVSQDEPEMINVLISDVGVKYGNSTYSYTDFKTYWIEYDPPYYQSLHLVFKKNLKEELTIHFHGLNPSELRLILTNYLPEWEEREKNFTENITRLLGL
jgi:hypothetical protein